MYKKQQKKLDVAEKDEVAKKKYKKDFAKKSKEEKSEIIDKIKDKSKIKYLSKVIKDKVLLEKLKNDYEHGKLFFCDPGMRSIVYGMASNSVINEPKAFDNMNSKCNTSNNFGIHSWN